MEGGNILQIIIDNKDRIKYIKKVFEDTGEYWLFKFKSKQKNIFGFNKCFLIEVYTDPEDYNVGEPLEMYLRLPFHCRMVPIHEHTGSQQISKILHDIYFATEYKRDFKVWESVGKLLKGCWYKDKTGE